MSSATPAGNQGNVSPSNSSGMFNRDYRILVGWVVLIAVVLLIKSTKFGYTLIYYSLLLLLFFLIVTQYQFFDWALAPFRSLQANLTFGGQIQEGPGPAGRSDITDTSGANGAPGRARQ